MLDPTDERFAETIKLAQSEGAEVLALKTNICSTEEMETAFATAWETFGRLDVVVANAGIINFGYTWELSDEAVEKALAVNLKAPGAPTKYAADTCVNRDMTASSTSHPCRASRAPNSSPPTA